MNHFNQMPLYNSKASLYIESYTLLLAELWLFFDFGIYFLNQCLSIFSLNCRRVGTREDEAIDGAGDDLDHLMGQARAIQRQLSQLTTGKVVVAVSREEELAINDAFSSVICKGTLVIRN